MRERPILFSGAMVKAILDGRKTQTRRVYKPRNPEPWELPPGEGYKDDGTPWPMYQDSYGDFHPIRCPYGAPGDRLWVRETFAVNLGHRPILDAPVYCADGDRREEDEAGLPKWRPSIHMPRWASRLTLEVEAVRVERLQEITNVDALAEGAMEWAAQQETPVRDATCSDARFVFQQGWDSLNAKRGFGWDANPFVWVIQFLVIHAR